MNETAAQGPATGLSDDELAALTKADLHVHLVGSAAPSTVAVLASCHPESGVPADAGELTAFFAFRDFAHFLAVYTAVSNLVRSPEDIVALVSGLAADMRSQGTAYAEVTVTPVSHLRAGIAAGELAQALDAGAAAARANGVELAWVYDISGGDGLDGARQTLDAALNHPPSALIGFGLGGPEAGIWRDSYRDAFAIARAAGLHSLPHAGESVGPQEIWAAIEELGAERIGHGIAAAGDPALLARLRQERITLEICPSSNVATGVVPSLAEHPLPRLLEAGVPVVLGSDDPPMFNTTLLDEYRRVRDQLGLTGPQLRALARASIEASFAPPAVKQQLLNSRDARGTAHPGSGASVRTS
ncbi:MAG TPA: adenosine deaminase [Streptosporangiaceae bacterium]|nr:adenosine deaminase [Streptosporangiaceae bacterium]